MKKPFAILAALALTTALTASLTACGEATNSSGTPTSSPESNVVSSTTSDLESTTESAPESTGSQTTPTPRPNEAAHRELEKLLEDSYETAAPGTAGSSLKAVQAACSLLNWSVGTTLTDAQIEETVGAWLQSKSEEEQAAWKEKAASIDAAYKELLSVSEDDAKSILEEAGCLETAAYPWGNGQPLEPMESMMKASGLRS